MQSFKNKLALLGGLAVGAAVARRLIRPRFAFRDKVCVITGGSRGLGLVLARLLAARGARVTMLARDPGELRRAVQELEPQVRHLGYVCDVTDEGSVADAIATVLRREGRIDVLINNAGVIQVGPLEHLTKGDFDDAINVHMMGPLYTTMAALPSMRKRKKGRIVNIASIGGKIAFPHMLPYVASKHGLVGLSDGLRHELRKDGIIVTTVCPGLMRTGSPQNGIFKGKHQKEYAWFAISDSLPLVSKNAERAARQILRACANGDAELTITPQARLATIMRELFPGATSAALTAVARLLPGPQPGMNGVAHSGRESQSWLAPSLLTLLGDQAAVRNNE